MKINTIKAIIGPRRAGKSTFALSLIKEYGQDFIYLNFDDNTLSKLENHLELNKAIKDVYGDNIKNIFVDEIQNLKGWEFWLNELQRKGYNVLATGSNANLLSSELSTHLTGRHIEIEILPFSFHEYKGDFTEFYRLGGFPDILLNGHSADIYIEGLESSILYKDIVNRYNIRNSVIIEDLYNILATNVTGIFSYANLKNILNLKSEITVRKYIQYLYNTYLCIELLPFKKKVGEYYRKSSKKSYLIDNNLIKTNISLSDIVSKKLENFVLTELMKTGLKPNKDLFYYKTRNDYEIDFVIKKGNKIVKAIQVAYSLNELQTKEREMRALKEVNEELGVEELCIVTWADVGIYNYKGLEIKVLPVKDFVEGLVQFE